MKQAVVNGVNLEAVALEKARALARAVGESPSFKAFEAAQEALMADQEVNRRLQSGEIGIDYGAACSPAGGCC